MEQETETQLYKKCRQCGENKHINNFHKHTDQRRRPDCKECRKIKNANYYQKTKERRTQKYKENKIDLKISQ